MGWGSSFSTFRCPEGYAEIGASILRILRGEYCCLAEIARYNLRKECAKYDLHSRTH